MYLESILPREIYIHRMLVLTRHKVNWLIPGARGALGYHCWTDLDTQSCEWWDLSHEWWWHLHILGMFSVHLKYTLIVNKMIHFIEYTSYWNKKVFNSSHLVKQLVCWFGLLHSIKESLGLNSGYVSDSVSISMLTGEFPTGWNISLFFLPFQRTK